MELLTSKFSEIPSDDMYNRNVSLQTMTNAVNRGNSVSDDDDWGWCGSASENSDLKIVIRFPKLTECHNLPLRPRSSSSSQVSLSVCARRTRCLRRSDPSWVTEQETQSEARFWSDKISLKILRLKISKSEEGTHSESPGTSFPAGNHDWFRPDQKLSSVRGTSSFGDPDIVDFFDGGDWEELVEFFAKPQFFDVTLQIRSNGTRRKSEKQNIRTSEQSFSITVWP